MPPVPPPSPVIRLDTRHLDAAHALSQAENWPHRREDWAFLLGIGQGFGILTGDRLIGTALLTPFGTDAATASMIIVAPAARGTGLGRQLLARLLQELGPRECRLVATAAGRPLYERLGFVASGRIRQVQGIVSTAPTPPDGIEIASPADLAAMATLDRAAIGMDRTAMLQRLQDGGATFLLRRKAGDLLGYVACRDFGRGQLVGPLAARANGIAADLLRAAVARHAGRFLRVDLTPAGLAHLPLLGAAGLSAVDEGLAMRRPGVTPCPAPRGAEIHALASQALG